MRPNRKNNVPLSKTHPELIVEWDFTKNGNLRPENLTRGSHKKVWWRCKKSECSYSWSAVINDRTSGTGCPACAGRVPTSSNNLLVKFPEISAEWDYSKNEKLNPEELMPGTGKKVWWRCKECNHSWVSTVNNRTNSFYSRGCPACAGREVTDSNSLLALRPEIASEWDYSKNTLCPSDVVVMSNKKVWWLCKEGHSWRAPVCSRSAGRGCPYCSNKLVSVENSLSAKFPDLCTEWDKEKNGSLSPKRIAPFSSKGVWWKCKNGHSWKTAVSNRTTKKDVRSCPYCTGRYPTKSNNLLVKFPELCKEWDYIKNKINPVDVTPGSGKYVWWKCSNGHSWRAVVYSRVSGYGCPICSRCGPVSGISQEWLDSLNIEGLKREYTIKELSFRVDGYDPTTNTIYEFLGDFWHGNPEVHERKEVNALNKRSFGSLYWETFDRFRLLEEAGYKVVYIWESEYKRSNKDEK